MQLQVVGFGTRAVPMLVETGSPNCYIADIALQNFECPTPYPDEHANIEIARKRFRAVVIKPGAVENERLLGLNILGMDAINARFRAHPRRSTPSERSCECPLVPDALTEAARSRPERSKLADTPPGRSGRVNPWRWTFGVTESWDPQKSKKSRSREFAS